MKKIAERDDLLIVSMTEAEFEIATKQKPKDVAFDVHVSLGWIRGLAENIDEFQPTIVEAKAKADELSEKLAEMITS